MQKPSTPITLRQYGAFLVENADTLAMAGIKSIPFASRNPLSQERTTLAAPTLPALAQVLLFVLGLAFLDKKKDVLKTAMGLPAENRDSALADLEASWPIQVLVRKSDGTLDLEKDTGLPRVELDATKLGTALQGENVAALVEGIDLSDPLELKALVEAVSSRATHSVKLTVDSGSSRPDVKGGFVKEVHIKTDPAFTTTVCEQDYLADATPALTCNAGYQTKDWIALTRVQFNGQELMLCDLIRRDESVRGQLLAELAKDTRVQGLEPLMAALESVRDASFSGEPQVFCGDTEKMHSVAPLLPLALFSETLRAKNSLKNMHDAKAATEAEALAAQIAAAQSELDVIKAAPKTKDKAEKAAQAARLAQARETLAQLKLRERSLTKGFLSVPTFTLLFGGTTPRNLASGLTTAVHSAPIFTRVRERVVRAEVSNKAFLPTSLVQEPKVDSKKVPSAFVTNVSTASAKTARNAIFAKLASDALQPLVELREAWAEPDSSARKALYEQARNELDHGNLHDKTIGLFVKGAPDLAGTAVHKAFESLIGDVCKNVRQALTRAFPKFAFGEFEPELFKAATAVVLMERA